MNRIVVCEGSYSHATVSSTYCDCLGIGENIRKNYQRSVHRMSQRGLIFFIKIHSKIDQRFDFQ